MLGEMLREWRHQRGYSQLALAVEAEISSRHLSFLETGRANPSRDMVLRLASVLQMPLRAQNGLLTAAGFAPLFGDRTIEDPDMAPVRQAIGLILNSHDPFPAAAIDGRFQILDCNAGFVGLMQQLGLAQAMEEAGAEQTRSLLSFIFADGPNRALIDNWAEVAGHMITRLKADAWRQGPSGIAQGLLDEALRQPGIDAVVRAVETAPPQPLIPIRFRVGDMVSSWITTMTSFGAPNDAYVEELSIEQFHPADTQTEQLMRQLATSRPQ